MFLRMMSRSTTAGGRSAADPISAPSPGGRYDYAGTAPLTEMICTYKSARDRGEFRLRRSPSHA
ncbi:MAG TPA: hypothetical protein VNJ04_04340 [Gemmatimonadaceae bacterium]|nr:hypothetical protein [Gemmatimonadaceae bacterium]